MFDPKSKQMMHQPALAKTKVAEIFARSRRETGTPSAPGPHFVADVPNALNVSSSDETKQAYAIATNRRQKLDHCQCVYDKDAHTRITSVDVLQL